MELYTIGEKLTIGILSETLIVREHSSSKGAATDSPTTRSYNDENAEFALMVRRFLYHYQSLNFFIDFVFAEFACILPSMAAFLYLSKPHCPSVVLRERETTPMADPSVGLDRLTTFGILF